MYVCIVLSVAFSSNTIQAHHLTQFGTWIFSSPGDSVMVFIDHLMSKMGVGFGHPNLLNPTQ
jgi:hypothetical protein